MDKSKARILYIEDYPVVQTMYVDALRAHGFTLDVASDGKTALELVQANTYDVILLDLLLPQVTGLEFLREFRAKNYPGEVVILSDFDDPGTVEDTQKLDVSNYWIKVENTPHLLADRLDSLIAGIDGATPVESTEQDNNEE
jgi:DNA-binding NarL/FixJ family response regulator